jgi:transglutaminase-like putative cysteine protease/predicted glutamine amidotransferase
MPNLLAMSFEGELAPSFDLTCLTRAPGEKLPDGWGLGYYPGGEPSAVVLKEPAPPSGPNQSIRGELAKAWQHLESSLFVLHIRAARWGALTDANTQPFVRSWGRRDWMIGHSGSLQKRPPDDRGMFEPVGSTDTEQVFCLLLARFAEKGWRSLQDADLAQVRDWLDVLDDDGGLTIALTDGRDLLVYADRDQEDTIHLGQVLPPYETAVLSDDDLVIDLGAHGTKSRKGVIISSTQMKSDDVTIHWTPLPPGHLIIVRQGAVIAEVPPPGPGPMQRADAPSLVSPTVATRAMQRARGAAEPKSYDIVHRTVYRYATPVERSEHVLRLTPRDDARQALLSHQLSVTVPAQVQDFDDVFDNRTRRLHIETPWQEMVIEARSRVRVMDVQPIELGVKSRSTIPLVWMPWQRQAMQPFLLPFELPESELVELTEYAMSFVKRNDYDLLDTLLDINSTIFHEYTYRQGSTTVFTSPYEVYAQRRGVCQDFTNLFINLARLLSVPARYVCGYIYTGPKNPNQVQSEASHAWVQLYLPEIGWRGFDPTNGVLTQAEHIRVAVGRNYRDATPTSGTIYLGGGTETMEVSVTVEPCVE